MIILEQPKISEDKLQSVLQKFFKSKDHQKLFQEMKKKYCLESYASWQDFKYKKFKKMTAEEAWIITLFIRKIEQIPLPIKNEKKEFFVFWELPRYRKFFHDFDSLCSGQILSDSPLHKNIFIQNGELEESIYSSKIEGAVTTISEAKRMIRRNQKPRSKDEQMIQNNYKTMQNIRTKWHEQKMSKDLLQEIHTAITKDTDLKIEKIGRLRKDADQVVVSDISGGIAHIPPNEKFLRSQIQSLVDFANDENEEDENYFHPLVKAIALHFWVGYLHPFVDGNGRLARSLFYWYLFRRGYWAIPFLPISAKIIKSPGQYRDAFLLSEQIQNDFNYFFEYNIRQVKLSMQDFQGNLENIRQQKHTLNIFIKEGFNERQSNILQYFFMKPESKTTIELHQQYHQISYLTARSDLLNLEKKGMLLSKKSGKRLIFFPKKEAIQALFSE